MATIPLFLMSLSFLFTLDTADSFRILAVFKNDNGHLKNIILSYKSKWKITLIRYKVLKLYQTMLYAVY